MSTSLIKMTGRPMAAPCLGMPVSVRPSLSISLSTVLGGFDAIRVESGPALWTTMRDERPMSAAVAADAATSGYAYAAGAEKPQQQHAARQHAALNVAQNVARRAFRGPDPWRERS
ncbi:hypothetical protein ABH925_002195 [Streptacidiphilus sp. EB129]